MNMLLDNPVEKWLTALGIAAAIWIFLWILRTFVHRRLAALSKKTASTLDDLIALLIGKIRMGLVLLVALYTGSLVLFLPPPLPVVLERAAVLVVLAQMAIWGMEIIAFWLGRSRATRAEADPSNAATLGFLGFFARGALWITIVLLALDNLGVQITTLIAGLGVGGIAIALAVQNILGDLFASLSIVLDKPFVIGDFIVVDAFRGTVEHVGLKTTRVRSLSGEQLVFSNADLLKSRIRNFRRMTERRVELAVQVVYGTSTEKLASLPALFRDVIEAQPNTRFERSHFKGLGDSALEFETIYWVTTPDYTVHMDVQQAINLALVRRFRAEGIEFAFPTQTVILEGEGRSEPSP